MKITGARDYLSISVLRPHRVPGSRGLDTDRLRGQPERVGGGTADAIPLPNPTQATPAGRSRSDNEKAPVSDAKSGSASQRNVEELTRSREPGPVSRSC